MEIFTRKILIILDIGGGLLGMTLIIRHIDFSASFGYILIYTGFSVIYLFCITSGLLLIKKSSWALISNKLIWSLQVIGVNVHFVVFRFFIGSMIVVWWKFPDNQLFWELRIGSEFMFSAKGIENGFAICINFFALFILLLILYIQKRKNIEIFIKGKDRNLETTR